MKHEKLKPTEGEEYTAWEIRCIKISLDRIFEKMDVLADEIATLTAKLYKKKKVVK